MKTWKTIGTVAVLSLVAALPSAAGDRIASKIVPTPTSIHDGTRRFCSDQIWWTRMAVHSLVDELKGLEAFVPRIFDNHAMLQQDLRRYYADDADKLGTRLEAHNFLTLDVIKLLHSGTADELEDGLARWYDNADGIADAMAALNPKFWPASETRPLWRGFLDLTFAQMLARAHGDPWADVAAFEELQAHAVVLADFMSDGITRQFPEMEAKSMLVSGARTSGIAPGFRAVR